MISNCLITANGGGARGGVYFYCTFTDNNGAFPHGGGAADATLNYCTLQGNSANAGGGASYSILNHCSLFGNSADVDSFDSPGGGGALACVLNYCLLITNSSAGFGGGASLSSLTNCLLIGNLSEENGGGAYLSTLDTCSLFDNLAGAEGGGAMWSYLTNCTLMGNSANEEGGGAHGSTLDYCVLTANSADDGGGAWESILNHCQLTGNSGTYGGGANASQLTNCIIRGNVASNLGGGVYDSDLANCLLTDNHADVAGGGTGRGRLYHCTLVGNSAGNGGGAYQSSLTNCIVYYNTATTNDPNHRFSVLHTSCTTPLLGNDFVNIIAPPAFIDQAGGNLRLASNSPCINTGDNAFASALTDLDGRPRIIGGTVDMGAYEFQTNVSGLFLGYLQQHGLPTDGTADTADSDLDRLNNYQEWRAGTIPTSALSALRLLPPTTVGPNLVVRWKSVPGKSYSLTRSTNLTSGVGFVPVAQNLPGQFDSTTYTDTNAAAGQRHYFYRVAVE